MRKTYVKIFPKFSRKPKIKSVNKLAKINIYYLFILYTLTKKDYFLLTTLTIAVGIDSNYQIYRNFSVRD